MLPGDKARLQLPVGTCLPTPPGLLGVSTEGRSSGAGQFLQGRVARDGRLGAQAVPTVLCRQAQYARSGQGEETEVGLSEPPVDGLPQTAISGDAATLPVTLRWAGAAPSSLLSHGQRVQITRRCPDFNPSCLGMLLKRLSRLIPSHLELPATMKHSVSSLISGAASAPLNLGVNS